MAHDSKYPPRSAYVAYLRSCGYKTAGSPPFALSKSPADLQPYLIWVERVSDGTISLKRLEYQWSYRIVERRFRLSNPTADEVREYRRRAIKQGAEALTRDRR